MHTLSISDMKAFIKHIALEMAEPVFVWGGFGVGKSQGIKQACREYAKGLFGENAPMIVYKGAASLERARARAAAGEKGAILCDTRLSQYDSVDLRGFPGVDPETGTTVWHVPSTLPFEDNKLFDGLDDWIITLFLDEANSASAAVSAVAYQLTNDRCVGEHRLRKNVRIVMAGNRETDKGVTNRQPAPLSNRLTHIEAVASAEDLALYAQASNWPPVFVAFIHFRKELVNTYDPDKPSKTVATSRTWEKAMSYFTNKALPENVRLAAMAGSVGEGPSGEFYGFVQSWAQIAKLMPQIVSDPEKAEVPEEPSLRYAVAVACSGSLEPKNASVYNTYLMRMDAEFSILAWQLAVKRDPKLFETKEFVTFSKRYKSVFV